MIERPHGTTDCSVRAAHRHAQPAISVDTKKKELVGPFKNGGPRLASGEDAAARAGPRLCHSGGHRRQSHSHGVYDP